MPEPAENGPVGTDNDEDGGKTKVFALHPTDTGCSWTVWDMQHRSHVVGSSEACPSEILWNPDGSETIYSTGDETFVAPWRRKGPTQRLAVPSADLDGWMDPALDQGRSAPWVAKASGRLRQIALLNATVTERGGKTVFVAGDLSIPVVSKSDGVTYGVRGTEVVEPGKGDRDVWLPTWGLDQIAVYFERGADGEWTQIAALPTRGDAGETPGISVGGDLNQRAPWPSLSGLRNGCGQTCSEDAEHLAGRTDLTTRLNLDDGDELGFVASSSTSSGFVHKVVYGDTPHQMPPVLSCDDRACKAPVMLKGLDDDQIAIAPRNQHVLITAEYTGARAKIYAATQAEPLFTLDDAVTAVWVPEAGLPKPNRK